MRRTHHRPAPELTMNEKTNVMRLLDAANIPYNSYTYDGAGGALSGLEVATALGQDPEQVYKTLVTVGASGKNYVFVIPVGSELNLKKAAQAVKEKKIEMLKAKDLLPLTGYVHGGCSPIGMKKLFPTVLDESVILFDTIIFSAGKIGFQVELSPDDLQKIIPCTLYEVTD